jgi:hypothetical protein
MRVRPAMMRADSIRQTASIARCVGVAVMATHHTIFKSFAQADRDVDTPFSETVGGSEPPCCHRTIAHLKVAATVCI